MVLEESQILDILQTPSNPNIKDWQAKSDKLSIYVNGGDVSSELEKIRNYENDAQEQLRKDLAKSPKDKVSDLLKPTHKVFNASGGSVQYDKIPDAQLKKFKELTDELPEGISLRQWMESYLLDAMVSDPNGITLIEIGKEGTEEEGKPYPTYKNINKVHDYLTTWESLDYLVLLYKKVKINSNEGEKEVQVYRVIDDQIDALYYLENDALKKYGNNEEQEGFDEQHEFTHDFGFVPAVVCGSIIDKETKGKKSLIHKIDESLVEYLRAKSVFLIYKFLHLFPRFWQYAMKCVTCEGNGTVENKGSDKETNPKIQCPTCKGKRLKVSSDVSDIISLPIPKNDQPVLGGNMAGFVDTPNNAWDHMNDDLIAQEKAMEFSLWGSYLTDRDSDRERTATESFINVQPINETLCKLSSDIETKESQIATMMAKILTGSDDPTVKVHYGKRFIIESPDALWEKYLSAKEKKAPLTTLDYHYDQYLMSEFQNDIEMYTMRKKIFSIEPYAHYSLDDLNTCGTPDQKQEKILFSKWINTDVKWESDLEVLKNEFQAFYEENKPKIKEANPAAEVVA